MYCPNCGAPNRDDVSFCASCGTKLGNQSQTTPAASQPTYYAPTPAPTPVYVPVYTPVYGAAYRTSPTLVPKIKALAASPLMLIAAISYSVSALLSVLSSIISVGYLGSDAVGLTLLMMIPSLICLGFVVAGLWHIYVQGKSDSDRFGTFGLGAIKGICIFDVVISAIAGGIFVIAMLGLSVESDGITIPLFFISIAVMVLLILFFSKASSSLGNVKNAVERMTPHDSSASGFVGVMCFFAAVIMLFYASFTVFGVAALDSLLYEFYEFGPEFYSMFSISDSPAVALSVISQFSSVVSYAVCGVLVFKYNSIINEEYNALYI